MDKLEAIMKELHQQFAHYDVEDHNSSSQNFEMVPPPHLSSHYQGWYDSPPSSSWMNHHHFGYQEEESPTYTMFSQPQFDTYQEMREPKKPTLEEMMMHLLENDSRRSQDFENRGILLQNLETQLENLITSLNECPSTSKETPNTSFENCWDWSNEEDEGMDEVEQSPKEHEQRENEKNEHNMFLEAPTSREGEEELSTSDEQELEVSQASPLVEVCTKEGEFIIVLKIGHARTSKKKSTKKHDSRCAGVCKPGNRLSHFMKGLLAYEESNMKINWMQVVTFKKGGLTHLDGSIFDFLPP